MLNADHVPVPRTPGVAFTDAIAKHWLNDNAVATHVINGVTTLFPAGERFFVRSVWHFMDRISDPVLKAQIHGFGGQEGRHAKEHERFFRVLEAQGFELNRFLKIYEAVAFGLVEKNVSPELCLAATAACEHFTAILAEAAFTQHPFDAAHPAMKALLLWHAAEEIEHRSVAFDVMQIVNPSYALRLEGLAVATALLGTFWMLGTATFLVQDKDATIKKIIADARQARTGELWGRVFGHGIRQYFRRDFHPREMQLDAFATEYLKSVGLA